MMPLNELAPWIVSWLPVKSITESPPVTLEKLPAFIVALPLLTAITLLETETELKVVPRSIVSSAPLNSITCLPLVIPDASMFLKIADPFDIRRTVSVIEMLLIVVPSLMLKELDEAKAIRLPAPLMSDISLFPLISNEPDPLKSITGLLPPIVFISIPFIFADPPVT